MGYALGTTIPLSDKRSGAWDVAYLMAECRFSVKGILGLRPVGNLLLAAEPLVAGARLREWSMAPAYLLAVLWLLAADYWPQDGLALTAVSNSSTSILQSQIPS